MKKAWYGMLKTTAMVLKTDGFLSSERAPSHGADRVKLLAGPPTALGLRYVCAMLHAPRHGQWENGKTQDGGQAKEAPFRRFGYLLLRPYRVQGGRA